MSTRREVLVTIAAAAALPALQGQPATKESGYFSPEDLKLLSELVDAIIPRTDTPGASDAGVPLRIDRIASRTPSTAQLLKEGLTRLRSANFSNATPEERRKVLKGLEESSDAFFKLVRDLTIDGYYSSREGLVTELGYHGNTFLSEFPGCTHPEHQIPTDAN